MNFRRGVIGQFHGKLLLFSEIAKAKAKATVVEPVKQKKRRSSLSSDSI